jgi:hypothetical protein
MPGLRLAGLQIPFQPGSLGRAGHDSYGGYLLFGGCSAGDSAASLVLKIG